MPALAQSQSNIHLDILMGRDETLDVADVFGGTLLFCRRSYVLLTYNLSQTKVLAHRWISIQRWKGRSIFDAASVTLLRPVYNTHKNIVQLVYFVTMARRVLRLLRNVEFPAQQCLLH
jgi:hypothetical protein